MNITNIKKFASVAAVATLLSGIMPLAAMAAVPSTTSITPSLTTAGSNAISITVNGSGFDPAAMVNFNGNAKQTTYVSPNQLTASVPASDFTSTGNFSVTVTNPGTGGGTSNAQTFTVGNIVPVTTSLSSSVITSGSGAFTLTVNGNNFIPSSVVNVNGSARSTTFSSSSQLSATILASDLASPASLSITVANPGPGGGTSGSQTLTVTGTGNNPVPTLGSISPVSRVVGTGSFVITVNGVNFASNAYVRFNGIARPTTRVSSTQLTAVIPASDNAVTGQYVVDAVNPTPGGGASNFTLFTITPTSGTPILPNTGFGPEQKPAAQQAVALAIIGTILAVYAVRRAQVGKK